MSQETIWQNFQNGQQYMATWPIRKELALMFPEPRYIKATKFATRVMPAIAVMSVLSQMAFNNYDALPQAIVVAFFALSMPLQGLWWLGKRSRTVLPPSLATWYREIYEKIKNEGYAMQPLKKQPRYLELAEVLNRAFQQLDKTSLERWF
ncbi:terminus macrodomain insulation protein YfbV [Photobacterium sp.]|uniref:terminus macrodomain insulation protein YfbV n=1 Tax=Photobacterium sp. TaxID=660 RepID=UPI00299D872B|nr:terminus macrodomain insulation protein YfbV [Photobacterium sp.]MDX1304307.1 terminus macrodomain insulation protein YfbV [Photobacterium sp.]